MAAKIYAARSEGIIKSNDETAYADLMRSIDHTVQPGGVSTVFNHLIGIAPLCGGNTAFPGAQEILIDGSQQFEVVVDSATEHSVPGIVPIQTTKTNSYVVKTRSRQTTGGTAPFGASANGAIAWENFTGVQISASTAEATRASSTFADAAGSLTFTPASQQDYLIIAFCRLRNVSVASGQPQARLVIDGTTYGNADTRGHGTASYVPVTFCKKINLTAASHTIKIQYASGDNFWTVGISQIRIIAIPLSSFTVAGNEGSDGTTSTSFANIAATTVSPSGEKTHLVIASTELTGADDELQIDVNGVKYYQGTKVVVNSSGRQSVAMLLPVKIPQGTSLNVSLQGKNTNHTNPRITVIDISADLDELQVNFRKNIAAATDDANINATDSSINTAETDAEVGLTTTAKRMHEAYRFTTADIKARTIDLAEVCPEHFDLQGSSFAIIIEGLDEDNTSTFSTYTDWNNRTKTSATVNWTPSAPSNLDRQTSSDIKTIIQEIVDRAGWAYQNAIGLTLKGTNAGANSYYRLKSFGTSSYQGAILRVHWKEDILVGTNHDTTLSDTVAHTDTLIKTPGKILSDTTTHTDSIIKQGGKVLSDTISHVDTVVKTAGRTLLETVTHTDTFEALRIKIKELADTLTHTDTVIRSTGRTLSDTVSHTDTVAKTPGKIFSDTVTHTDSIIVKITARILTETVNMTDTFLKSIVRLFTETISHTDTVLKQGGKNLTETVTHTDTFTKLRTAFAELIETVTHTDTLTRTIGKMLSDSTTLADSIIRTPGKVLSDALTHIDTIIRTPGKVMTETSTQTDSIIKTPGKVLSDSVTHSDTFIGKITARILIETVQMTDSVLKVTGRLFSESISHTDVFIRSVSKTLSETLSASDTMLRTIGKNLIDSVTHSDTFNRLTGRTLSEQVTHSDTFLRTVSRTMSETISHTDTVLRQAGKNLIETVTHSDTFARVNLILRTFTETVTHSDTFSRTISKVFTETTSLIDTILLNLNNKKWYARTRKIFQRKDGTDWKTKNSSAFSSKQNINWFEKDPDDWKESE